MSLRWRLLLTIVIAAVPLVAALGWFREQMLQRAEEDALRDVLVGRMEAGGRERCEQDPGAAGQVLWRSRGSRSRGPDHRHRRFPPPTLHAYDAGLRPSSPQTPPLPEELREALVAGADAASRRSGDTLQVAVRMPWDEGPCAVLLAERPRRERPEPAPGMLASAIALTAGFAIAVVVAAGPVVRRIGALSLHVRRSAAGRYAAPVPVEGRDEVGELARAFNDAAREVRDHVAALEKREATLRDFVANTTHDLMLPLSVLLGNLSRMRQRARDGALDPALVESAVEEAQYLSSLVHNLAAAAKLEAGEVLGERHPVDVGDVVERVVERHRALAAARGVELNHAVPEEPLRVSGDVTLLEQAVGNLVSNAVRHNRPGGHAAIVLEEDGAERFVVRVADDGPGVSPDEMARLGERRFRTEEARQRHPEGRGLGLAIVRDVAERHGFELRFAPGEPSGLVVELRGPRAG